MQIRTNPIFFLEYGKSKTQREKPSIRNQTILVRPFLPVSKNNQTDRCKDPGQKYPNLFWPNLRYQNGFDKTSAAKTITKPLRKERV
jgi:hypothetical protein